MTTKSKRKTPAAEMKRTWLIQRLNRPRQQMGSALGNPFSFGGGYRNGGLADDAMRLLQAVWSFDYMGAAEFEFGAVPKALQTIASADLVADSFTIRLADVEAHYSQRKAPAPDGEATIYVLCAKSHRAEVEERIRHLATKDYELKEATRLPSTLRPATEWGGETVGWLELDNGFLFFTDRAMWESAAALFGVKAEAAKR